MKNKFSTDKIKDKKLLRKVKKNWVVISLSVFGAVSFGGIVNDNTVTHADVATTSESTSTDSAASSSDNSSETSSADSSAASSSDNFSEASSADSSAASNSTTSSSAISNASRSATSSGKSYAYSVSVIDPNQTSDSYNANDGTNIQNINDFDLALTMGDSDEKYLKDSPNWVTKIDPMGAAWAPLISQYIKNGNYILIPQDNINNAENLFNNYVNNYNLSDNYSNFEGNQYNTEGSDYSIKGLANAPLIQDETGLKNVNPHKNPESYMYDPKDKLQLAHIIVQTDFGDGGNSNGGSNIQAANSDNEINVNLQSLEPYAGHYEAPIYQIVMNDLSNQVATYPANYIDSNASDDDMRQATAAIPLDYLIFLHPQVYNKDKHLVVSDLSQSPIVNVNYIYNGTQNVGSQKIFTDNQSSIDEDTLTVPTGYSLANPDASLTISEGQDSVDVPVTKDGDSSSATSSASNLSSTTSSTSTSSNTTSSSTSGSTTSSVSTLSNTTSSTVSSSSTTSSASTSSNANSYATIYNVTTSSTTSSSSSTSSASSSSSTTSSATSSSSTTSSASDSSSTTSSSSASSSSSDTSYSSSSSSSTSSESSSNSDASSTDESSSEKSSKSTSSSDTSYTTRSSRTTSSAYNDQSASKANSQSTNKNKLPQTNENNVGKQLSLIGLVLIAFSAIFGALYKRNKNN